MARRGDTEPPDPAVEKVRAEVEALLARQGTSIEEVRHRQAFVAALADAMSEFLYGSTFQARYSMSETFERAASAALFRLDEDGFRLPPPREVPEPKNALQALAWKLGFRRRTVYEKVVDGYAEMIKQAKRGDRP